MAYKPALLFIFLFLLSTASYGDNEKLAMILIELRTVDSVSGILDGYAGTPGVFYKVASKYKGNLSIDEINSLIVSKSSITSAMGLWLMANSDFDNKSKVLNKYKESDRLIILRYFGCVASAAKLGDFVEDLIINPNVLDKSNLGNQ
jgi:hypothetical protein